ncbi:hypothetical protein DFP73DRAFT_528116 [Morchella snyderi]|nr:hypothetical protein DFP73DRAFT_528116 [Morchella snyderi]
MTVWITELSESVGRASTAYRAYVDLPNDNAKMEVIDRTRISFEIANAHIERLLPAAVQEDIPEMVQTNWKSTVQTVLTFVLQRTRTLLFWIVFSFLLVAGFGCISASMSTLPGSLPKPSRVRNCEILLHLILGVTGVFWTRADSLNKTQFGAVQFCMGLTAVTIFEGCVLVTKAVAIYKDVEGPAPLLNDRKSLIFEVTSIALRSIAVIAAAILTCKNTRSPDTPQRVQEFFTLGAPGELFSSLSRADIAPHLTTLYRSAIVQAVIGARPVGEMPGYVMVASEDEDGEAVEHGRGHQETRRLLAQEH